MAAIPLTLESLEAVRDWRPSMPAGLIAVAIAGAAGVILALALAAVHQMTETPRMFENGSDIWPYTEIDYLWWDEGICWAAR
jgi:hypothetical protein